ncbi:MAG: hypothetical protein HDR83_06260 [Bacteroides sp.]|nr:hypothetical protein [Bacteroides sp.]
MKKSLIFASLLASLCITATAQQAVTRTMTNSGRALKQLNAESHRKTLSPAKARVQAMADDEIPADAVNAPFSHDLGKNSSEVETVKKYISIDANNDGRSWKIATVNNYSACMPPNAEDVEAADDWMISVPVLLQQGTYNVSVDLGIMGSSATGINVQLMMGTAPTAEAMTIEVSPVIEQTEKDQTKHTFSVDVSAEGYYYIGLHNTTTKAQNGTVKYFNLAVDKAPDNAIKTPFSHDMGKNGADAAIVNNYTVIDANEDSRTWKLAGMGDYTPCMAPNAEDITASDDWIITVPVYMTAGNYTVAADLAYLGSGATGMTVELKLGTAPTVEGMIAEIAPATVLTSKDRTTYEYPCAIPADGYYYIGLHNLTTKEQKATVKFHKLSVTPGEVVKIDPPAAGELSWVVAPKGELKATVTYTAPTKTVSGDDLKEISKVVLTSRWGVDTYTFTDVTPGQVITQEVDMYAGFNNRFTGVAYVEDVAGEQVEYKSIFCGPDCPLAPTDVTLTVADDYKSATLTWTAPGETGENGGYVDTDNLTYYIFDAFGTYYDPAIATTSETSYTINYSDLDGQDFFAYQVTAGVGDNYSLDGVSNIITAGEPAPMPFNESFVDGYYDGVWMSESDGKNLMQQYGTMDDSYFESIIDPEDPEAPAPLKSRDGDNGFFYWLPVDKDALFGLISVRTDISKAAEPALEFWYQGQGSTIDVLVAGGTDELSVVKTIDLKENPVKEWTLAQISLDDYKAKGAVQFEIRLLANHNDDEYTWSVPLDNICIRDLAGNALRVFPVNSPAKAKPGTEVKLSAQVENVGKVAVAPVAQLFLGEELIESKELASLEPRAMATVDFGYNVPLIAAEQLDFKITFSAEGVATDAENSTSATVEVVYPIYPSITELAGLADSDNNVRLSWTAPNWDELKEPSTVEESFESEDYTPLSINGAGEWTVYDGDKSKTYNVFRELNNPYQTAPIGFQLFNREVAEVQPQYWEDAAAHSGESFMLAPSAAGTLNDNWLISPRLSGREQTITFWAKGFSIAWPESFKVYYSTTGNTVDCFTEVIAEATGLSSTDIPEEWTMYTYTLPAGATYFAICHDSYDSLALFVDDVTYEGSSAVPDDLEVTGYHVFRDGQQLTDEPVKETEYVDALPTDKPGTFNYDYAVVPVYNHGTARATHANVSVSVSGIEEISIEALTGAETIYNLSGMKVDRKNIIPGVYIIATPERAKKAFLK